MIGVVSQFFSILYVFILIFGSASVAEPLPSLFGPMGRMIEPKKHSTDDILPLLSLNEADRVSKVTGIPRNILRAYEKQGFDAELVAVSILSRLEQGQNIEQIVPKPTKELANQIADEIEGIDGTRSSILMYAERLLQTRPERILSVEYANLNSASFIYITYYRDAECLKILDSFEKGLRQGCPNCERRLFDCNTPKTGPILHIAKGDQLNVPYVTLNGQTDRHFILGGMTRRELNQVCDDLVNDIRREGGEAFCVK